ncbi:MAG: hypothetical protein H7281_02190 [Bacteriovorax sp.]|nr:hypothetical protein [Bacteriovorax sp.]
MALKKTSLFCMLIVFSFISCSNLKTKHYSPKDDQYWEELVNQSIHTGTSIQSILEIKKPSLYYQILNDSKDSALINLWGQSLNFDSGAKKKIINDQVIADLQALFGIKNDNMIVHAGITHTYGYLFSVLETPYGFKRKRWVEPTLNYAFSFNGNSLSPETMEGGLLSNITYFIGTLAFKNKSDLQSLKNLKNVSSEVLNFDYSKLTIEILDEQITGENPTTLRTTLVRFPFKKADEENDYLLIYSVLHPKNKKEVLITAFPIKKDAYKKITARESLGANQPIIVRYNAYLEGLVDKKLTGFRKLSQDSVKN